jgi:hypothetical protein
MSTLVAQTISNGTVSTSSANVIQGSAKAWVNFNGANGSIFASYNLSSVTRTGTGLYTLNFTNALADGNYAVVSSGTWDATSPNNIPLVGTYQGATRNTTSCQVSCNNSSSQARFDNAFNFISIFR